MSLRAPTPKTAPHPRLPGRPTDRPDRGRRAPSRRARDHSRVGIPTDPTDAVDALAEDDAAFQAGLLDDEFDVDDPTVTLRSTRSLAVRLRNEEDEHFRLC